MARAKLGPLLVLWWMSYSDRLHFVFGVFVFVTFAVSYNTLNFKKVQYHKQKRQRLGGCYNEWYELFCATDRPPKRQATIYKKAGLDAGGDIFDNGIGAVICF